MAAAVKEEVEAGSCPLYTRRACSPGIPRVAPGTDYLCIPAGADNSHAWSLLVGFLSNSHSNSTNNSGLGLHRFRVARSGRILGRSDDTLDILRTLRTIKGCSAIASVSAELTPDGCSICLFSEHLDPDKAPAIPRASELRVTARESGSYIIMSPLPRIPPDSPKKCRPVSAAGHLWAPNIKLDVPTSKCFLGMLRLNRDAERWEKAGDTFSFPLKREELVHPRWGGPLFQGYAVLHNNTILVSLRADQGLLTFNCLDCTWTEVATTKDNHTDYIPILGRGVHIKKHVYFLRDNCIFAYKLCYDQDRKYHQRKLKLEPPAMIHPVCPFYEEGYGFLTHLGGPLMCSVWISTLLRCSCDYQHVLITTFRLRSTKAKPKGIDILHSTCRRLHVFPLGLPIHEFCFLQVYEDKGAGAVKPSMRDHPTSSHVTEGSSKMLDCCRVYEDKGAVKPAMPDHPNSSHVTEGSSKMLDCCSTSLSELGHNKFEDPPKDPALQINKL